jgi:transcriptional regulator with XRE-family HTH domain
MVDGMLAARMAQASAFSAYLRELRNARQLSQEKICNELRQMGFRTSVKDVYEWENGIRKPSSAARAGLIQVIDGSPAHADELLLCDVRASVLITTAFAESDTDRINELLRVGVERGRSLAREWLEMQLLTKQENNINTLPAEMGERLSYLGAALFVRNPSAFKEWLRFGYFRLAELEK